MGDKSNYLNKEQIENERAACSIGTVTFNTNKSGGFVEIKFAYEPDKTDHFKISSKQEVLLEHYYLPKYAKAIRSKIKSKLKEINSGKSRTTTKRNTPIIFCKTKSTQSS